MIWVTIPNVAAGGGAWTVGARFVVRYPMAICNDDQWLDEKEGARLLAHAEYAWRPLLGGQRALVCEGKRPLGFPLQATQWAEEQLREELADIVLLGYHRPRCPFGHLVYALGPSGARILLEHGLPVEERVEALFDTLADCGLLRVASWETSLTPRPTESLPRRNVKQYLPDLSLPWAAAAAAVLAAFSCWWLRTG